MDSKSLSGSYSGLPGERVHQLRAAAAEQQRVAVRLRARDRGRARPSHRRRPGSRSRPARAGPSSGRPRCGRSRRSRRPAQTGSPSRIGRSGYLALRECSRALASAPVARRSQAERQYVAPLHHEFPCASSECRSPDFAPLNPGYALAYRERRERVDVGDDVDDRPGGRRRVRAASAGANSAGFSTRMPSAPMSSAMRAKLTLV